ncbi:MAG: 1-acyl-sn-glycerol-3-phosphate acyltransferase [Acidobacteria bacterium]|nr:1-acyl-sn-glycerol-3-phosphate acyltransferase [Acidobacteriota bacterium]
MSLRKYWAIPAIALMTVVMSTLAVLSTLLSGKGRLQHGCARLWARFILRVSGVRWRAEGLGRLPADRPCILMSNHQSNMDIPILLTALPIPFRFLAKESLFRIPFLGWYLRRCRHIPIHREDPRKAVRSLRDAAEKIRGGVSVLVFPEGTRSEDGHLQEFKKGGFLLGTFSGALLVPVAIAGSRQVLPKGSSDLRSGKVSLAVGEPLDAAGASSRDADRLMDEMRRRIEETFRRASGAPDAR